jgi:hypothetical protein
LKVYFSFVSVGEWKLESSRNYGKYLRAIGVGYLASRKLRRSQTTFTLYQDDKGLWQKGGNRNVGEFKKGRVFLVFFDVIVDPFKYFLEGNFFQTQIQSVLLA